MISPNISNTSPIMSPRLTRLILLIALCSVAAGCHRAAIGYPAPK
jgi:hypothetical protein